ncbi:MAG: hypothetical protein V2A72_05140 [Candidatus Omnitrophota bacterium]
MKQEIGYCDNCSKKFKFRLIHNGFNESSYAYCDKCGKTTFFYEHYLKIPNKCKWFFMRKERYEKINEKLEKFIKRCSCGGKFKKSAKPRCPNCKSILSARKAANYIEKNAAGLKKGWQWYKSWNGGYAIVIEDNEISNNWKDDKIMGSRLRRLTENSSL